MSCKIPQEWLAALHSDSVEQITQARLPDNNGRPFNETSRDGLRSLRSNSAWLASDVAKTLDRHGGSILALRLAFDCGEDLPR